MNEEIKCDFVDVMDVLFEFVLDLVYNLMFV